MFSGSIVALVTPMHADDAVDFDAIDRLVEFHVDNGTDGIVAVGTTGESATLDIEEHIAVVTRIVAKAAKRLKVIAGTGANSTSEAIHWTKLAKDVGVDACLLVTPYYNKPTQEGLYRHFRAIAEAVDIPLLLYNVPARTACDMKPETVARLAEIRNIVGIKEASGSMERNRELLDLLGDRFCLLSGDDQIAVESTIAGFRGVISVSANIAPRQVRAAIAAALEGQVDTARSLNETLKPLHRALFVESNPIPIKWALARLGLIGDGIRLPLTPLSEQYHAQVLEAVQAAGIGLA
ncbi:MAG: 4-hydroxy-tetrahydrodipicolinate synthase [Xanthomonadaceae bacterium]|nr:4-hydroxy-tetrahydrodipicolinate synthase [Xanthomonadaceae bacterium]